MRTWVSRGMRTALLVGLTVAALAPPAAARPAAGTTPASSTTASASAGAGVAFATGDTRKVTRPTVPATCAVVAAALPTPAGRAFTADQEAAPPDTARIQQALTGCAGTGRAVELAASGANNAFLSAPLNVGAGETLLVDAGVTLFASRVPDEYQISGKPTCGTVTASSGGCRPFLAVTGANSAVMGTQDASGGQGRIDGRGDRTLVGGTETWWQLATDAKNLGENQNDPRLLIASANNFVLYHVDLLNSPNFHVMFQNANGFTAWGVRIKAPANARNTDGIDPSGATNVTIIDSYIQDGDDGVAIKGGAASSDITIVDNHFYGTHGISIGSETNGGVTNVLVADNTMSGVDSGGITSTSDNGLRIKSDSSAGGLVSRVTYVDTCLTGVKYLLDFDPNYSTGDGTKIPTFSDILVDGLTSVASAAKASSVLDGYDADHPLGLTLAHVRLDATATTARYADIGLDDANITASGTGVTTHPVDGVPGFVPTCQFPSYPGL
jgi:polygalacturonase